MPSKKVWVKLPPKPVKLEAGDKKIFLEEVRNFISKSQKLAERINRITIKAGRIYLYFLYKPMRWNDPEAIFIKPLIDGKYNESIFARITLHDKEGKNCTTDWQRHNEKWITLKTGTLKECLEYIETDNGFFNLEFNDFP
ncbi:MAG: hypothetical protein ACTSRI_21600 [Promethearchaeota archaeon]